MASKAIYYDTDTEQRKRYFSKQFFRHLEQVARRQGLSVQTVLSSLTTFARFKELLEAAFSNDTSLLHYYDAMTERAKMMFFQRNEINSIVEANLSNEQQKIQNIVDKIPVQVHQVEKRNREYFKAERKGSRTFGYRDSIRIGTRTQTVYRDNKGRFVSKK